MREGYSLSQSSTAKLEDFRYPSLPASTFY